MSKIQDAIDEVLDLRKPGREYCEKDYILLHMGWVQSAAERIEVECERADTTGLIMDHNGEH